VVHALDDHGKILFDETGRVVYENGRVAVLTVHLGLIVFEAK
jgi:hypothetical protein